MMNKLVYPGLECFCANRSNKKPDFFLLYLF